MPPDQFTTCPSSDRLLQPRHILLQFVALQAIGRFLMEDASSWFGCMVFNDEAMRLRLL